MAWNKHLTTKNMTDYDAYKTERTLVKNLVRESKEKQTDKIWT